MRVAAFNKFFLLAIILVFVQSLLGCAPSISQEQYDSVQAELKSTREQLATTKAELESLKSEIAPTQARLETIKKTWSSTQPYLELSTLIYDNWATLGLENSKAITKSEAMTKYADQNNRFEELMKKFDDTEFVNSQKAVWYISLANPNWQSWYHGYNLLRSKLTANVDELANQINP